MFAGAVVLDLVAPDQLLADGDLELVTNDSDLHLTSTMTAMHH